MKKKKCSKRLYVQPECKVHKLESENFFCTSVHPNAQQTVEENWEPGEDVDGGTIEFWWLARNKDSKNIKERNNDEKE